MTLDPWGWICHMGDGNQIGVPPEEQQVLLSTEVPLQPQACFSDGEIGVREGQAPCCKANVDKKKKKKKSTYSALAVSPA